LLLFAYLFFPETDTVGLFSQPELNPKRQLAVTGVLETGSCSTTCRPKAKLYSVLKTFPLLSIDAFRFARGCWNCTAVLLGASLPEETASEALLPDPSIRGLRLPSQSSNRLSRRLLRKNIRNAQRALGVRTCTRSGWRRHFGPPAARHGGPIHLASHQL
jgi:hypothetical protein